MYTYHVCKWGKLIPADVFVALHGTEKDCNEGNIMIYAPIGQHGEANLNLVQHCRKISKEVYKKVTENLYTPEEYIK